MENYITLFDSIKGKNITLPFNQPEIDMVQEGSVNKMDQNELVCAIYAGLMCDNNLVYFIASLSYLLKSETYRIGNLMNNNSYYIYVSRGDGYGFCRFCGSVNVKDISEANIRADKMINLTMSMVPMNKSTSTGFGTNQTKSKKKRK